MQNLQFLLPVWCSLFFFGKTISLIMKMACKLPLSINWWLQRYHLFCGYFCCSSGLILVRCISFMQSPFKLTCPMFVDYFPYMASHFSAILRGRLSCTQRCENRIYLCEFYIGETCYHVCLEAQLSHV